MKRIFRAGFFVLLALIAIQTTLSAQDLGKIKKQADLYYKNNAYTKALYYYTQFSNRKALDRDARYNMGVASYETNNLSQALKIFSELILEKNYNPRSYFYLGRLAHGQQDFDKAEQLYKQFLRETKERDASLLEVRNLIRNCNVGNRQLSMPEIALVENLGRNINTQYDDFGAIQSPNYGEKIYFSSARKSSKGGLRNRLGQRDNEYGKYNSDLFFSKKENGTWIPASPMGGLLNSQDKDVLLGFSQTGNVSYLFRGKQYEEGRLLVDTFIADQEEAVSPSEYMTPIDMSNGDNAPYFFNDSIVLFSSYRQGGYGGYDIYAMVKSDDSWSQPFNLGPEINSSFDEQYPHLARNGRTLYFSSNNCRASIGGFDVFQADYDEESKKWSTVKNMGMPINSAEDDTHFHLTKDGTKGLLSSRRKTGLGERDIYIAYFKKARSEQNASAQPITFIQLEDKEKRLAISQQIIAGKANSVGVSFEEEEKIEIPAQVNVEPIYYSSDRDLLSEANKRKIDVITELLKLDNTLSLRIECHTSVTGPLSFDMYFSIKRAEKVAQAIIDKGIPARKIQVTGFGPLYPIALNEINGIENEVGKQLNNRVEFKVQGKGESGIDVQYVLPVVSKFQADQGAARLERSQDGLTYKIQIASTGQMFDDAVLDQMPDPKVDKRMTENRYVYSVGTYRTFQTAVEFKAEMVKFGLTETKILPYIDGDRLDKNKGLLYLEKYPDLQYFFKATE